MGRLEVKGLEKSFGGVTAVSNLSFSVPEGIVYSIIGPNGAGKTTLFNLLTGIYRPDKGSIVFQGKELVGREPHKIASCGISRTFQNLQIFLNMSVLENVMAGCHLRSRSGIFSAAFRFPNVVREEKRARSWAAEALEFCGLGKYADRTAGLLPYGILKKLEIARSLAFQPALLLMDEPAAGLNDTETLEMCSLIKRLRDAGIAILLVEHNMGLIMEVSERLLVLNYGRLLAEGSPHDVQKDPRVIAAYLGE